MTDRLKILLNIIGTLLAVIALGVIGHGLVDSFRGGEFSDLGSKDFTLVLALGVLCGMINGFLCEGFYQLTRAFSLPMTRRDSWKVFGLSQIGKYIPGNIFHLLGRQALGGVAGADQKTLAKITVIELGSLAVTGGLFLIFILDRYIAFLTLPLWVEVGLFIAALCLLPVLLSYFLKRSAGWAFLLHMAYLVSMGLVFLVLLRYLGNTTVGVIDVLAAYIVSWLIGFITPGAPAGIGIRDLILLTLLSATVSSGVILVAVVLSRLMNIFGDVMTFLVSVALRSKTG